MRGNEGRKKQQKREAHRTIDERFVRPLIFVGVQQCNVDVNDESAVVEDILNNVEVPFSDAVIVQDVLIQNNRSQAGKERREN